MERPAGQPVAGSPVAGSPAAGTPVAGQADGRTVPIGPYRAPRTVPTSGAMCSSVTAVGRRPGPAGCPVYPGRRSPGTDPGAGRRSLGAVPRAAVAEGRDVRPERDRRDRRIVGPGGANGGLEAAPRPDRAAEPRLAAVHAPADGLLTVLAQRGEGIRADRRRRARCRVGGGRRLDHWGWREDLADPRLEERPAQEQRDQGRERDGPAVAADDPDRRRRGRDVTDDRWVAIVRRYVPSRSPIVHDSSGMRSVEDGHSGSWRPAWRGRRWPAIRVRPGCSMPGEHRSRRQGPDPASATHVRDVSMTDRHRTWRQRADSGPDALVRAENNA